MFHIYIYILYIKNISPPPRKMFAAVEFSSWLFLLITRICFLSIERMMMANYNPINGRLLITVLILRLN